MPIVGRFGNAFTALARPDKPSGDLDQSVVRQFLEVCSSREPWAFSGLMFRVTQKESLQYLENYCPWVCSPRRSLWLLARRMPKPGTVAVTGTTAAARTATPVLSTAANNKPPTTAANRLRTSATSCRATSRRMLVAIHNHPVVSHNAPAPLRLSRRASRLSNRPWNWAHPLRLLAPNTIDVSQES
jgi:hypothetical protein